MQGKSRSVYSSHDASESEPQQEWMQKYYALLTATEFKEKLVAETIHSVENEVQGLNEKVQELQNDKKRLEREVEKLREMCKEREGKLQTVEIAWAQDKALWQRGAERERRECALELEELSRQLMLLKRQFSAYQERNAPERTTLMKKLHQLESTNQRFRKENVEIKHNLAAARRELRQSRKLTRSSSLSRSAATTKRSNSKVRLSPAGRSLEDMLASVEARLQQAKELVMEDQ